MIRKLKSHNQKAETHKTFILITFFTCLFIYIFIKIFKDPETLDPGTFFKTLRTCGQ